MKRQDFSKKILKMLSNKVALSTDDLKSGLCADFQEDKDMNNTKYAINRSLKNLQESGLVNNTYSGQNNYIHLTKEGKQKAISLKLDNNEGLINTKWDGYYRIIIIDLPESRKNEREALRYLLKKADFICLKNSVWISPFPFEHLFLNIKQDLKLTTELMIFVTSQLDPLTQKEVDKIFEVN